MRFLLNLCVVACLAFVPAVMAEDGRVALLVAADAERLDAMKSADKARLAAVLSDELHYAHSSGTVDTKQSFIEALTSGRTKYLAFDYTERAFTFPAPGIALMKGRAKLRVAGAGGEKEMPISFLAVWRAEDGRWRFLAWQSCRLPAPGAEK